MTLTHRLRRPSPTQWSCAALLFALAYAVNTNVLWFLVGYSVTRLACQVFPELVTREGP